MKINRGMSLLMIVFLSAAVSSCGGKKIERIDASETKDLSGRWNDTDSRLVAEEMIKTSLSKPWLERFKSDKGRAPVIITYGVKNRSSEHINTQTFMKDLEGAFVDSGEVDVVADKDQQKQIRGEQADQNAGFTADPVQIGKELGADFVLTGVLNTITDQEGKEAVIFYQTNLELIGVETSKKVWIGSKKIKKYISRAKMNF
ncbi:MAG: penicillin-binding protein activator LpoB [Deltaproteobacteria bacterium]|nr:penicillin-binding protein activator LpoB [Deltaproteobacteria bacterium]